MEICEALGIKAYQSKSKYADICALIASNCESKRLSSSDEFIKSGIIVKTIRLNNNGMPKESMSFKNIDYCEVFENDNWIESEAYEVFTSRFLFAVFKPDGKSSIKIHNNSRNVDIEEPTYILDSVFFWTMPVQDLELAQEYWQNIRDAVLTNNITTNSFWHISDHKNFHVRPKARDKADKAINPNGGMCDKYCYWFNAEYVKKIIDDNTKNG
jgi:DNA mismatch repair protein MutH